MINEEAIKAAFDKLRDEKKATDAELKQIKALLEDLKKRLESLENKPSEAPKEEFHTKSRGPFNNNQQSTINNNQQQSTPLQQSSTLEGLKKEMENRFKTLTDREFSVFLALYQLDKEKGEEITYPELSLQLKISEASIRGYINTLINKKLPIQKNRFFNGKVSLSIKPEFKQLNLYQKLLGLRANKSGQKTLFDI